jgi:signal transduction histidine kinase
MLERMNSNIHELALTIDNLLDFLFASANAHAHIDEEITIGSLIAELTPLIEAANQNKGLTIKFEYENTEARFRAPRRAIRSILANLALNAVKFTDNGSVTIAIRGAGRQSEETEIEIRDTGHGLTPAELRQATEPFLQLSRSSKRRYRGLGLGLTVVKRNVSSLGASLNADSAPGKGSIFTVRIPRPMQAGHSAGKRGRRVAVHNVPMAPVSLHSVPVSGRNSGLTRN